MNRCGFRIEHSGAVCVVTLIMATASTLIAGEPVVSNQTDSVGLGSPHTSVSNGFGIDYMTAGGAAGDFDNDGDQDLFLIGGSASTDRLYINDGSGHFVDQAVQWGVARTHTGSGAAVGDFNNDGWLDIMVTSMGPPNQPRADYHILYKNNGDGTFSDVTDAAGLGGSYNPFGLVDTFSPTFGDYDLDGDLDLAVAGWYGGSKLFRNNGDGTFTDVTLAALDVDMTDVRAFAPRFVDMDGDRYPEILWVADFETSKYFRNNTDGTFTNMTPANGTGIDSNGMGNTYGDYNTDGIFDWYVTSRIGTNGIPGPGASGNMLYMGTSTPHVFNEESVPRGANFGYWGWGAVSLDLDHDGHLDIFATNGFSSSGHDMTPSLMYLNDGSGNFTDIASECGMDDAGQGRGVVHADFDNDGDRDILLIVCRDVPTYYRNDLQGAGANAITLFFDTSAVPGLAPNGFGTRVSLVSENHSQLRYLDGGSNYLSQSELSVHAGLGDDPAADITITWSNGQQTTLIGVVPGRYTIAALSCPADLSPDGSLDFFDISAFLDLFLDRHPQADFSPDGRFDFFDISAFINQFASGCP